MTTLTWPPAYDTAIEHELFLLGYRNLTVHVVGHVGLSLLVAAGTWFAVPHTLVLGWLAWMLCLALIFCLGVWAFRWRINTPGTDALALRQWKNMHVWMVTLPGIGWGSAAVADPEGAIRALPCQVVVLERLGLV